MINQENIQGFIKWANIVAILTIIFGALAALGGVVAFIIGAAPGVLMIISGVKLLNAKKAAQELVGIEDPVLFSEKLNQLISDSTAFFKFQGIYYIASLVLGIIGIIIYSVVAIAFISNMPMY
ncbi:MAG: hypothetical protein K0S75_255 [Clostridia bacterium]|jgi:hypothetical protein|nr:hypothetical protein [Clostridia bacterium]